MGRASSRDALDETVLQILQTTPISSTARFRRVVGAATAANSRGFERYQDIQADLLNQIVGPHFGITRVPKIAEFVTDPRFTSPIGAVGAGSRRIGNGNVAAKLCLGNPSYDARQHGSPDVRTALIGRENADTLLQTLLAHAAVEEIDYTANRLVQLHHKKIGRVSDVTERFEALRVPEILHAEKPQRGLVPDGTDRANLWSH